MHFPSEMCFILPKSMDEPKSVGLLWVIIFIILYGIVSIIFHKFIFLPFYDYNTCVTSQPAINIVQSFFQNLNTRVSVADRKAIIDITEYLNQNLSKDFPLIALSTYAYMNISKFKYVFKPGVGQVFSEKYSGYLALPILNGKKHPRRSPKESASLIIPVKFSAYMDIPYECRTAAYRSQRGSSAAPAAVNCHAASGINRHMRGIDDDVTRYRIARP